MLLLSTLMAVSGCCLPLLSQAGRTRLVPLQPLADRQDQCRDQYADQCRIEEPDKKSGSGFEISWREDVGDNYSHGADCQLLFRAIRFLFYVIWVPACSVLLFSLTEVASALALGQSFSIT